MAWASSFREGGGPREEAAGKGETRKLQSLGTASCPDPSPRSKGTGRGDIADPRVPHGSERWRDPRWSCPGAASAPLPPGHASLVLSGGPAAGEHQVNVPGAKNGTCTREGSGCDGRVPSAQRPGRRPGGESAPPECTSPSAPCCLSPPLRSRGHFHGDNPGFVVRRDGSVACSKPVFTANTGAAQPSAPPAGPAAAPVLGPQARTPRSSWCTHVALPPGHQVTRPENQLGRPLKAKAWRPDLRV